MNYAARAEERAAVISFVITAHNEELLLPRTLESIRAATAGRDPPVEVIVVDDASTDRTADIARTAGARVVRIEARQISAASGWRRAAFSIVPARHSSGPAGSTRSSSPPKRSR